MTRTPASTSVGAELGRGRVGQRQEDDVRFAQACRATSGVMSPAHSRASAGSFRAAVVPDDIAAVSGDRGMPRQDAQQLLPGIAGRAGDGDAGRRAAVAAASTAASGIQGLYSGMHGKEYLYTAMPVRSTRIDV